jgi:transcriptional regulator with XRE-family HTH domain
VPTDRVRVDFGHELCRWRVRRGLTQDRLARIVLVSASTIHKVEKAVRWPPSGLAARCDVALDTGGALQALVPAVEAAQHAHDRRRRARRQAGDEQMSGGKKVDLAGWVSVRATIAVGLPWDAGRACWPADLRDLFRPADDRQPSSYHRELHRPVRAYGQQPRAPCCPVPPPGGELRQWRAMDARRAVVRPETV